MRQFSKVIYPAPPPRVNSLESVYLQLFLEIQKRTMNQRLNLEQAIQFVLSPGSDSELSELLVIDDDEEDEIIQSLREKKINKV